MVDVNVDFVLENDEPIEGVFELEPDVTYNAEIVLSSASRFHNDLFNRDLPDQHPMGAITGLDEALEGKVEKTDEPSKVYGTDDDGEQTTYELDSFGKVDDVQVDGISIVENKVADLGTMALESLNDYYTKGNIDNTVGDLQEQITANHNEIGNIGQTIGGYGNIVTHNANEFATAAQGVLADTAVQPNDLATVATSGSYNDLSNKPTIGNATLTIQKNGDNVDTFTANATSDKVISITVPTTASDVGALPDTTTINDLTTTAQQNALNSGATSTNIGQIATNTSSINAINDKIPAQASSSNQLADKNFVNSSIATNRANFIGTFANVAALESYVGTVTNNDYAFVINSVVEDNGGDWASFSDLDNYDKSLLTNVDYAWVVNGSNFDLYRFDIVLQTWELRASNIEKSSVTLNRAFNEYKATDNGGVISWEYEYTLNNSSFTATQWAAINSGITSGDVALIQTAIQPSDLATVATSGNYNDLSNKPTIGNATLTIQKNGTTVNTFTANATSDKTINLTVPTATSDLANDSGFITSAQLDVKQDNLTSDNAGTNISITAKILPDEYQLLEYLGANDTISLGFPTTNNSKIECSWKKGANNAEFVYQSDSDSSLTTNTTAYSSAAGNWRFGNRTASINTSALADYLTIQDNTGVSVNGVLTAYSTVNTFTSSTNLKLFQSSSQKETILIKYLKHYTSGVLDFHILPCKRIADDTYGFYDVVGGNFYTKAGADWEVGQAATDKTIISFVNNSGFITGITSGDVTTALGYTPVNPSSLATVATSGSYNDLLNKPTIPTVNNATLTIQKNSTNVATFTANASSNVTANITVPTNTNELTNGAGFITGINSSDVTTALGYTPANDSNVVKTSGNQTVGGVKTFNAQTIFAKGTGLQIQGTNHKYVMRSTGATYEGCALLLDNDTTKSAFNAGTSIITIGSAKITPLSVTPATSDNSTKIATTAFVKAQGYITSSDLDGVTIDTNSSNKLEAIGVIDNNGNAIKTWTGTLAQYNAIVTKDSNTLYNITDDIDVSLPILEALYPVGSVYITTANTCPLSTLINGSTWVQETSRILVDKGGSGTEWWELYSDGWCVQGGHISKNTTVVLAKEYKDTNYSVSFASSNVGGGGAAGIPRINNTKTTTGFVYSSASTVNCGADYVAFGYTSTTTSDKRFRRTA